MMKIEIIFNTFYLFHADIYKMMEDVKCDYLIVVLEKDLAIERIENYSISSSDRREG